jgi:nicotinamidase/pyrazinamidase
MTQALLLIDLQNDFMPGGALAVPRGDEVVKVANEYIKSFKDGLIIATQDWHPADHKSFASNHPGKKPFVDVVMLDGLTQVLWTDHCVQNTHGAEFHDDLLPIPNVFCKGEDPNVDSYSGFFDNGKKHQTQLDAFLKENKVDKLVVMGLATDYCVKFTVLDARALGYQVDVVEAGCRAVNLHANDDKAAFATMLAAGARIV